MFKSLFLALSLLLIGFSCAPPEEKEESAFHHELTVPTENKLVAIECGKPCIITFDPQLMAYVATFAEGGSMTVFLKPNVDSP